MLSGIAGHGAFDLYSIINAVENARLTGVARFTAADLWATLYFDEGRIVHADHATPHDSSFEAVRLLCEWHESKNTTTRFELTRADTIEQPPTLLEGYVNNSHLILDAVCELTGLPRESELTT